MGEPKINYDVNSHIFRSTSKTGGVDPTTDTIVYDGGNLEELLGTIDIDDDE